MSATATAPVTAAPAAVILDEAEQRRELAVRANREISALANGLVDLLCDDMDNAGEEMPMVHGMLARIQLLSDLVWHAANLVRAPEDDLIDLTEMQRHYKGWI